MPDLPSAARAQVPAPSRPQVIDVRSRPDSRGRGERGLVPGGRDRRARATRQSHAGGPRTVRPSFDAAPDGWEGRRLLLDHISDAVFATDTANRITQWTVSAGRLFGYSANEAVGRSFSDLLGFTSARPGDELERAVALEAGRTWLGAGTARLRDGRKIWIGSSVDPIRAHGRLVGSVSVSRDITAIHNAQLSLANEERFVSSVFDVVGALVLVLDPQGRIMRFNRACERLSGYESSEVLGRVVWDVVVPPAEVDEVRAAVAALRAGAFPNSHESHWTTHTGSLRLISWQNTCLTDDQGTVTHVISTGIDITERKSLEDELQRELVLMHALMENLPSHIYFKDLESRFIRINKSEAGAFGLSDPGQAIGKTDFDFFTIEHAQQACEDEREVIRTGLPYSVEEKETRAGLPDTWVSTTKVPLRDKEGRTIGTFGLSVDITDRRQADEALRERERLFVALAEFAAAVNAIREPELLIGTLLDAVGTVVPSDTVVITMLDRSDGRYRVRAVRGLAQAAVGAIIEPGVGTGGRAISERTLVSTGSHPRAQYTPSLRGYLPHESMQTVGVPLINEDGVLGAISVGRADTVAAFTAAEREVLALLGAHAALALANANLVDEVSALAIRDGLTGLYNRRHFDAALDLAIARFKRNAPAGRLAAIMFDLDHFGEFNRHHGHLAGDALLRVFAEILRNRLRSADVVARYGGEEFVAILEGCDLPEANRLADEVRGALEARWVPGADGRKLHATVSAGCAVLSAAEPTKEALLGTADVGLYMAKEAGRNRVVGV